MQLHDTLNIFLSYIEIRHSTYTKVAFILTDMTPTKQLKQEIKEFYERFLEEESDIEDVARELQKLADKAWDEAVEDVSPSIQIP